MQLVTAVPSILKDALKVTSENIEKTLQKTLEAAYQFTGTYVCCVLLQRLALTSITCVLHSPSLLPLSPLSLSLSPLFSLLSPSPLSPLSPPTQRCALLVNRVPTPSSSSLQCPLPQGRTHKPPPTRNLHQNTNGTLHTWLQKRGCTCVLKLSESQNVEAHSNPCIFSNTGV